MRLPAFFPRAASPVRLRVPRLHPPGNLSRPGLFPPQGVTGDRATCLQLYLQQVREAALGAPLAAPL